VNLSTEATLIRLSSDHSLGSFDCGSPDLNEFLQKDAILYQNDLMGVTYLFTLNTDPSKIVCFFTVANDGLHIRDLPSGAKSRINSGIPREKQFLRTFPSVKIGRLGVNCEFRGSNPKVGNQVMDFIKGWFVYGNKTGCKFILVDAYNNNVALRYYDQNHFKFIFSDEDSEANYFKIKDEYRPLKTRIMYFDLERFIQSSG
jgi:hypothetical protein